MKTLLKTGVLILLLMFITVDNAFPQNNENMLLKPGHFFIGCNYWASNAGTAMWADWNPQVIEQDFKRLSDAGVEVLRIFPTWNDFQPISALRNASSKTIDYRFGEKPLPDDRFGAAGVSAEMVNRMKIVLDLGAKYHLKFIIGLLTGHMSGRIFIPPAFDGQNPLTDTEVIEWEVKYLKCLVNELKSHPAIIGWGLGNETNCMGSISRNQAYTWASLIANTIRACDSTRPVLSDMHSLTPEGSWSIIDQGEITDILTTHPYPYFTPYCDYEPINTMRPLLHGAAESRFYSDIGGRPALIEETGSLGPMFGKEDIVSDFFRTCMFSAWANDCHGTMWWCNSNFTSLLNAPYDWYPAENELGLFKEDGAPKPIVQELKDFSKFYAKFPYQDLPRVKTDAVCILTRGQDSWSAAQSAFILGKQAGLNIEFQFGAQPIKDAKIYLLPSLKGSNYLTKIRMNSLLQKVKKGAVLYISMDNALFADFELMTGLRIVTREETNNNSEITVQNQKMTVSSGLRFVFEPVGATVISSDQTGNPVFTKFKYGEGTIYFLSAPLESYLTNLKGYYDKIDSSPLYLIYKEIGNSAIAGHLLNKTNPFLGITEHFIGENKCIAILINYSPQEIKDQIGLKEGWSIQKTYYGNAESIGHNLNVAIPKNNAVVIELKRK